MPTFDKHSGLFFHLTGVRHSLLWLSAVDAVAERIFIDGSRCVIELGAPIETGDMELTHLKNGDIKYQQTTLNSVFIRWKMTGSDTSE